MSDKRLPQLPNLANVPNDAMLYVVYNGESYHTTKAQLLASIENRIIAIGTITHSDLTTVFGANFQWKINGVSKTNASSITKVLTAASVGFQKVAIGVLNASNGIDVVYGDEVAIGETMVQPPTPVNTLFLTRWDIIEDVATVPTEPIVGDDFVEKAEFFQKLISGTGSVSVVLDTQETNFRIVSDDITMIEGTSPTSGYLSQYLREDKLLSFINKTANPIVFKHSLEANNFRFPNGANLTVQPNELIRFRLAKDDVSPCYEFDSLSRVGGGTTQNLQQVTDVDNETTNEVIVRQDANNYVVISNYGYAKWFTNDFGNYPTAKECVTIGETQIISTVYQNDGDDNFIPSTKTFMNGGKFVAQDIINNNAMRWSPNGFEKIVSGVVYQSLLPNQNNFSISGYAVVSLSQTAVNSVCFNVIANATITDPTPTAGMGYHVNVINGVATVGGVAYSVGTKLFRHYHSGSWRTFVYPSTLQLENFLRDETLLKGYVCLTPNGINAPNSFRDVTYSSSTTTGYILQNSYGKTGAIGMVGFQSTAVAGTVAFKRRNDSYIFTNTNATIWQKIEFDSNVSGARFHHLLSNNFQFTAPTNVNQTSLLNCVGFCKLATSDNLHILHNDSSGTATVMDLGASFPANNSSGNKRYLLGIQIKATSYVLTVIEINTTTNALTTNIYTTEVSTDIPARSLSALQISTMITNNATASNATYLDGGLVATNLF